MICRFKIFANILWCIQQNVKVPEGELGEGAKRCLVLRILMDIDVRIGELYWADVSQAAGCSCTRQPQQAGLAGVWQHYHPQGANIKI